MENNIMMKFTKYISLNVVKKENLILKSKPIIFHGVAVTCQDIVVVKKHKHKLYMDLI